MDHSMAPTLSEMQQMMKTAGEISPSLLQEHVGKKLLWASYDEKSELFYLLFEGEKMLSAENIAPIGDFAAVAKKFLDEQLANANRVKELEAILKALEKPHGRETASETGPSVVPDAPIAAAPTTQS